MTGGYFATEFKKGGLDALIVTGCAAAPCYLAIDGAAVEPKKSGLLFMEPAFAKGDAGAGLAAAATRVEAAYLQPPRHHNPIEPPATTAVWDGDEVTLYDSTQGITASQLTVAHLLGVPPSKVRVMFV